MPLYFVKLRDVIPSAVSRASPTTNMQGGACLPVDQPELLSGATLHFGCWGGCASSGLDHCLQFYLMQLVCASSQLTHSSKTIKYLQQQYNKQQHIDIFRDSAAKRALCKLCKSTVRGTVRCEVDLARSRGKDETESEDFGFQIVNTRNLAKSSLEEI